MKSQIKIIAVVLLLALALFAGSAAMKTFLATDSIPTEEELLASIPKFDVEKYNRFLHTISIDVGNVTGDGKDFTQSGAIEIYKDIDHLYNIDVYFSVSGYKAKTESWTCFSTKEQYKDLGNGNGWIIGAIKTEEALERLEDVINNRDNDVITNISDSVCTVSWRFETDIDYLFSRLMSYYTDDLDLSGYGRMTAVFDPATYEFQYFTVVISANNASRAGALLDAVFYWEVVNDDTIGLIIPAEVSSKAYEASTGVATTGGYDEVVNPMAEGLMNTYGGEAEVVHDNSTSSLFWTMKEEDTSVAVNYIRTDTPSSIYEENHTFLASFYGGTAEDTDNGAYFYDSGTGELTYIAVGNDWYAEVIITGEAGTSQGALRKALITYKSKLGI